MSKKLSDCCSYHVNLVKDLSDPTGKLNREFYMCAKCGKKCNLKQDKGTKNDTDA